MYAARFTRTHKDFTPNSNVPGNLRFSQKIHPRFLGEFYYEEEVDQETSGFFCPQGGLISLGYLSRRHLQ